MKKLNILAGLFFWALSYAQAPANYYSGTNNLSGAVLKTKLHQIIKNGHQAKSYNQLYTGYRTTDTDHFYENDGSVLDMYSENPNGNDSYNYTHGQKKCGSYNSEGDCYNREHIVPQSLFNKQSPMVSDIHFVRPSDGKVNGERSNFPFGVVRNATFVSRNGSKRGTNATSGYSGTVFEPIDEFKGDIARMIFYFITRYQDKMTSFDEGNILAKNTYPSLQLWQLQVLYNWHLQDPVSASEVARNNAAYTYQGNRNPFIDHPEWVAEIWGTLSTNDIEEAREKEEIFFYPNPIIDGILRVSAGDKMSSIERLHILSPDGRVVKSFYRPFKDGNTLDLQFLPSGVYVVLGENFSQKIIVK